MFIVKEKSDDVFSREGNDLYCRVRVSLVEALAGRDDGGEVVKTMELLDRRKMQVTATVGCDQIWLGADDLWRGNADKEGWEREEEGRHECQVGSRFS